MTIRGPCCRRTAPVPCPPVFSSASRARGAEAGGGAGCARGSIPLSPRRAPRRRLAKLQSRHPPGSYRCACPHRKPGAEVTHAWRGYRSKQVVSRRGQARLFGPAHPTKRRRCVACGACWHAAHAHLFEPGRKGLLVELVCVRAAAPDQRAVDVKGHQRHPPAAVCEGREPRGGAPRCWACRGHRKRGRLHPRELGCSSASSGM
jgi:hypothetical protein